MTPIRPRLRSPQEETGRLRKPAAAAPAVNPLDPPDADTRFHRSGVGRVAILGGAIAVLVVGILIGLPSLPGAS